MSDGLPIREVLPGLKAALADVGAAVLIAPPGAGKTTAVAIDLMDQDWCTGRIILTSPRRVAARAAAERMSEMLGEKPGSTVGYMTRLESKVSKATRILVVTEAILVNRLIDDPELNGVSAILFDEAHERHLDSDLGLALALETRSVLRDDLRLLVMSATIDGARFASLLGEETPVIESEGRSFPLEIRWLGNDPNMRIEDQTVRAIMVAWRETEGDILVFLPGVGEIERVRIQLETKLADAPIFALHGQIEPSEQRKAIRRDPDGRRRIVIATAIAETSLTLDGVCVVVDAGLARMAQYDRAAGTTHLVTQRASQAAAAQRAGRAARQRPGIAYRQWEEAGHLGRPEFAPPEIEQADLSSLLLKLAKWGSTDPLDLAWLDEPPSASIEAARRQLAQHGAIGADGRITEFGEAMVQMPMAPDQAAALLIAAQSACADETARLIMLLQERGLGGRSDDLAHRLANWRDDRSVRAQKAARMARNWSDRAVTFAGSLLSVAAEPERTASECLAMARPDFVARRRDGSGENWLSAGGRGFRLDPTSPLAKADWIVIGDAQGQANNARITAAAEIATASIDDLFSNQIEERVLVNWNKNRNRIDAVRERRLGAIKLSTVPIADPDSDLIVESLVEKALENVEKLFPTGFIARAKFAEIDALSEANLRATADVWLAPLLTGRRDLDIAPARFADAALATLEWAARFAFEDEAPTHFTAPTGTRHLIDYSGDDAPSVEVRAQALFGLDRHPMIGRTPLLLKLTSPAGRPIQSTRDLPRFWRGSWADVAKDMKGRYPKHRWPDQPWLEKPSLKTKNAFNRE